MNWVSGQAPDFHLAVTEFSPNKPFRVIDSFSGTRAVNGVVG